MGSIPELVKQEEEPPQMENDVTSVSSKSEAAAAPASPASVSSVEPSEMSRIDTLRLIAQKLRTATLPVFETAKLLVNNWFVSCLVLVLLLNF